MITAGILKEPRFALLKFEQTTPWTWRSEQYVNYLMVTDRATLCMRNWSCAWLDVLAFMLLRPQATKTLSMGLSKWYQSTSREGDNANVGTIHCLNRKLSSGYVQYRSGLCGVCFFRPFQSLILLKGLQNSSLLVYIFWYTNQFILKPYLKVCTVSIWCVLRSSMSWNRW